jgi:hypothetical protein
VQQCRRILKPKGSMVVIIHPNCEKLGQMLGKEWNLIQDA